MRKKMNDTNKRNLIREIIHKCREQAYQNLRTLDKIDKMLADTSEE